jgi:mono/diheme cytochrome c family protein
MHSTLTKISVLALCSIIYSCVRPSGHLPQGTANKDSAASSDSSASSSASAEQVHLTYEEQQGKILYAQYCTICHGDQGRGDGFNAYNLDPKPRDFTDPRAMAGMDDITMAATISGGGKGVNKSPLMPAWGGRLNKLEMDYVIRYVKFMELQH